MISSTSNSNLPRARWALAAIALAIAAVGLARSDRQFATAPAWYWRMKAEWRAAAAIVLAGDSRVYRGLDPAVFEERLGQRCLNFGFSGGAFDARYLDAIERLVAADAAQPVIVLGVSAWSLTPRAASRNGFTDAMAEAERSPIPARWLQRSAAAMNALRPFALDLDAGAAAGRQRADEENYIQNFHLNGWVSSDFRQRDVSLGLEGIRADHRENRVDPQLAVQLAERVAAWRARGWRVVAFVPPMSPASARLTAELAAWDVAAIARQLERAGAVWVQITDGDYESYDGIHLTAESAQALSRLLAGTVAAQGGAR